MQSVKSRYGPRTLFYTIRELGCSILYPIENYFFCLKVRHIVYGLIGNYNKFYFRNLWVKEYCHKYKKMIFWIQRILKYIIFDLSKLEGQAVNNFIYNLFQVEENFTKLFFYPKYLWNDQFCRVTHKLPNKLRTSYSQGISKTAHP